jgi:GntR family transcriptional regulator
MASKAGPGPELIQVVPLYKQLQSIIGEKIENGEWLSGQKIPSEQELSKQFNISRVTVRAAQDALVADGYLIKIKGKGTFVVDHSTFFNMTIDFGDNFQQLCVKNNVTPRRVMLGNEMVLATKRDASFLGLSESSRIICIKRLLLVDDRPFQLETIHLPEKFRFALSKDFGSNSLYEVLKIKAGIRQLLPKTRLLRCSLATTVEAKYLGIISGAPTLVIEEVVCDENKDIVHYSKLVAPADKVHIRHDFMADGRKWTHPNRRNGCNP